MNLKWKFAFDSNENIDALFWTNHSYTGLLNEDIILMKLMRVKQIEDNAGKTLISEGIDANYQDMINYSVFCLIKLNEA